MQVESGVARAAGEKRTKEKTAPLARSLTLRALLSGALLAAFLLRVACLDCQSLWVDEITSVFRTTLPLEALLRDLADNLHTPAYYVALRVWTRAAGHSEFAVRYFSVLSGLLTVPLLYWSARRLFRDRHAGLLAALLATINPLAVVYAQETRMYALLPAVYLAALALAARSHALQQRWQWLLLALLEILALYLHLFSLFMVLVVNLVLLGTHLYDGGLHQWRRWLESQALVAVIFLPWVWLTARWGGGLPANLADTAAGRATIPLLGYLDLVWAFLFRGLTGPAEPDVLLPRLVALCLLLLLVVSIAYERHRRALAAIALALFVPLLAGYPVWQYNPLSHPRYLVFLVAPLLLLLGRLLSLSWRRALSRPLLALAVLLLGLNSATALLRYYTDADYARLDMRALATAIAEKDSTTSAALMPPGDHSLWYYPPGPATPVNWPALPAEDEARARELGSRIAEKEDLFFVTYQDLYNYDAREQIPFLLELNGRLQSRFTVDRMDVAHYALEPQWDLPAFRPASMRCGPLELTARFHEEQLRPGHAAAAALRWRLQEATEEEIVVSVRLQDGQEAISAADASLLDAAGTPTSAWKRGQEANNYYILPIPLGTAPLTYTLQALVYTESGRESACEGEELLPLGRVRLLPGSTAEDDPYGSWAGVEWKTTSEQVVAPGLQLEGYTFRPARLRPAETIFVSLRWRALHGNLPHYEPELLLRHDGTGASSATGNLFKRYPTERWQQGELLIETRSLIVPPTLDPLALVLDLQGQIVPVARLSLDRDSLLWELPAAAEPFCARIVGVGTLAGFRWEEESQHSGTGTLTLYWRAGDEAPADHSYTVFTHLLSADGHLLTQHDGLPARGQRPTTTWVSGEIVPDPHPLILEDAYEGPATLSVGLYDPLSGERLTAKGCSGRAIPDDAVPLTTLSLKHP